MTILKDISIIWSLVHTLVMFLFLFESRYSKKKTLTLSLCAMIPLILVNFVMFVACGVENYTQIMLLTLSLPSFIFFWVLAKHRDGRFVFTFCMIDTTVLEILYITNIIDHYIPGYWFMFVTRLLAYPLLEWFICKRFRFIYRNIQSRVEKGWWIFAAIGVMFYIAMTLAMSYPTMITDRPEYLPVFVILLILMPVSYIHVFNTLLQQQRVHTAQEQESILKLQVDNMKERIEALAEADEKFRVERHDFRHKMQTIARMIENKEFDELRNLVLEYSEAIQDTKIKRYCESPVLDAVFSSYLSRAQSKEITVTSNLRFPETLPASEAELATVFANAIENAINACEKIDTAKRLLDIKVIKNPRFMFRITNSFDGNAEFDENGIPLAHEEGHGFGTRSIVAFCNKYGAFYEFKADCEKFILQIVF